MIENTGQNTISTNTPNPKKLKRRRFFRHYLPALLVALVILLALTSAYFYKKSKADPNAASQAEVRSLIQKIGRLAIIPTDETPTVATVSDPEALKNQAFFLDAKKGYKVLIYSKAKKAILYDPVSDKIVNIAPLNAESTAPTTTPTTPKTDKKN
ncbi:MAG: hypothetical protein AAB681_00110 [Patescibacteria group bacterium]